jgi:dTDP-4-dehydrorhamnose reductase
VKKILILGGDGMLGHKAYQVFSKDFDTWATFLDFNESLRQTGIFDEKKVFSKIDVFQFDSLMKVIDEVRPDFIFNGIGMIKQREEAKIPKVPIYLNSLFPHLLAEYCEKTGPKLIHVSTDCVFSGEKGNYVEDDFPDAEDFYGRTKFLGEINYGNALTLRTSLIGRELFSGVSLVDWFLAQENKSVHGYVNAIYTGLTTIAFCYELKRMMIEFSELRGLYHLSSEKINKFQLLCLIQDLYGLHIEIQPDYDFFCDRSLDSTKYRNLTKFVPHSWEEMIKEMFLDPTPYKRWRGK